MYLVFGFIFFSLWEEESLEVVKCVGSERKDIDLRQSFAGMPGPPCANAGNGCGGRSRPKTEVAWEFCGKCNKIKQGKILTMKGGVPRWKMKCVNANTSRGILLRCTGKARVKENGEKTNMCGNCFLRRNGAQTEKQAREAGVTREVRKRKAEERETPDIVQLHVVTVQSNFARLTLHKIKKTHVERLGIMCGRKGDWVALRVSKCKKATCFEEYLPKGAEKKLCSDAEICGCGKAGHIVGMVQLGVTDKVCRKKVREMEWLEKTCCVLNEPHSFVTELTRIEKLEVPYAFARGNVMPVLGDIPTHVIPKEIRRECIAFAAELSKRIQREKERKDTKTYPLLYSCGREGINRNCETCAPVKK